MSRCTPIVIVDTGSGNLRSVAKALEHVGGAPTVTGDPDVVRRAERLVVPGQGAFGAFVQAMHERGLEDALREHIGSGRPYLGLCLGLQVLFEVSEEHGPVPGLGVLPGQVVKFRPSSPTYKVPHMGWNQVERPAGVAADPLLAGIPDRTYFYFVHSYYVAPANESDVALTCDYEQRFTAAVRRDNVFACQFHPEKSHQAGLRLLANFVEVS
ncbi:imidazole glycerol phosphate synthase subunit HisH [Haliangium sp.]|uniref:imidazole glycerol phosphate synthase subunit HisH n=1 Tax=Haliangium sp. TaxID=2663208 RepID=UPI003D0F9B6C